MSYVRSRGPLFGVDKEFFANTDVHIHVPEGAIPKDGPSAGVTMATVLASLLTDIPVRSLTAMTGEITLSGNVLPVGGIKEKFLAARRAGVTTIILPAENRQDVEEDLTPELTAGVTIHYASRIEDRPNSIRNSVHRTGATSKLRRIIHHHPTNRGRRLCRPFCCRPILRKFRPLSLL